MHTVVLYLHVCFQSSTDLHVLKQPTGQDKIVRLHLYASDSTTHFNFQYVFSAYIHINQALSALS